MAGKVHEVQYWFKHVVQPSGGATTKDDCVESMSAFGNLLMGRNTEQVFCPCSSVVHMLVFHIKPVKQKPKRYPEAPWRPRINFFIGEILTSQRIKSADVMSENKVCFF